MKLLQSIKCTYGIRHHHVFLISCWGALCLFQLLCVQDDHKCLSGSVFSDDSSVFCFLVTCRSASLQHVNNMLREQLEEATSANQQLTLDIQKLTVDWNKAREELEARDEEEQAYFANEHLRLMEMWKSLNNFRRQFSELKSATQRFVNGLNI